MIPEGTLNSLKAFKISTFGKENIVETFPMLLANCCRTMRVPNIFGQPQELIYDWGKFVEFRVNLGTAIYNEQYDYLDNIIIEFFQTYSYKTLTPKGQLVVFTIEFPEEAVTTFENTCNAFKGKLWDNILDDFLNAFHDFVKTATVHGDDFVEWR